MFCKQGIGPRGCSPGPCISRERGFFWNGPRYPHFLLNRHILYLPEYRLGHSKQKKIFVYEHKNTLIS